jgi:predicted nucleotidyltransferase
MVTISTDELGRFLLGKTRSAVLGLLLLRPDEEFHVRQAVRLSGGGLGPVQKDLRALAAAGVLTRREVGRQVFYRADKGSPVYEELRGLVLKTVGAAGVIGEALGPLARGINVAFLFGSIARGEEHSSSDVDVMIVGGVSFGEVARALLPAQRKLGRDVNPNVYMPVEFAAKVREGHHFLSQVMRASKVFVLGDQDELARVAEERVAASAPGKRPGNRRAARGD